MQSAKSQSKAPPKRKGGQKLQPEDENVGDTLRRVYREAVDEAIPDDLLALLSKLD